MSSNAVTKIYRYVHLLGWGKRTPNFKLDDEEEGPTPPSADHCQKIEGALSQTASQGYLYQERRHLRIKKNVKRKGYFSMVNF